MPRNIVAENQPKHQETWDERAVADIGLANRCGLAASSELTLA